MAARKPVSVAIDSIDVSNRVQPLDESKAHEIAASMAAHDGKVFNPVGLRATPRGAKTWALVHGRHRLRALEIRGISDLVEGVHFTRLVADAVQARLIEIEENMARTDTTPFGRAVMLAAYREASGIEGRGGDRKSDTEQQARLDALREGFTVHAMRTFELSSDQVSRLLRIGTALTKPSGLADRLHFSKIARNQSQLLKLAALPDEQLASAAEAFDAAKGDFFNLMAILSRPAEGQSALLAKLRAGASLADMLEPQAEQQASFDYWQQAVSAFSQLDHKGRVSAFEHYWKNDQKAIRTALKTLGYELVKLGGGE